MKADGYVDCLVSRGFFPTEYYVQIPTAPKAVSAFVWTGNVRVNARPEKPGDEVEGQVYVYVIDAGASDVLVELPGTPVVGGLRTRIPRTSLRDAV
jgi:hypothetical protein